MILKGVQVTIYRIFLLAICAVSLALHFKLDDPYFNATEFSYFTVWSNIFCFVMTAVLLVKHFHKKNTMSKTIVFFKGMATSAIFSTNLIYHFAESCHKYKLSTTGIVGIPAMDLFAHYIVPVCFILDWILCQPKGLFKIWHAAGWLVFPLIYFLSFISRCCFNTSAYFRCVQKFPYFFMDFDNLGVWDFSRYIACILFVMCVVNCVIVVLDICMSNYKH